jgi:predicted nucleotidyltransferase
MASATLDTVKDVLAGVARSTPGLELLLVFGSRARGEGRPESDWDFGFLAGPDIDVDGLLLRLVDAVGSDRVDVVDLAKASGHLRFRAARDGVVIHARREGLDDEFRLEAARFWCDAEPVLRRGYDAVLAEIDR